MRSVPPYSHVLQVAMQPADARPDHYVWCASQHHRFDPTTPASKWDTAWRALRTAAGLPGFRFHDLRHTVVTDLLEAGEPEHVIEAVTGHLSRRMLEHYSHQRLKAKGQMLTRMEESAGGARSAFERRSARVPAACSAASSPARARSSEPAC